MPDGRIAELAFAVPLTLEALVSASSADDAPLAPLIANGNPVIEHAVERGRTQGEANGRAAD